MVCGPSTHGEMVQVRHREVCMFAILIPMDVHTLGRPGHRARWVGESWYAVGGGRSEV